MAYRTGNPALRETTFKSVQVIGADESEMTLRGTAWKTSILLMLLVLSASWIWLRLSPGTLPAGSKPEPVFTDELLPYLLVGSLGGFIVALVTIFNRTWSPVLAPVYAILEGLAIGGISLAYEAAYPGIVIEAAGLTFGTLGALLLAYMSGLIRPSENFKLGVVAATGGICLVYLTDMALRFFGLQVPFINDSGPIGIVVSLIICGIAAANLVLDFDFIEYGVKHGAPKYMEWYSGFGLLLTLVWLYLEILRFLAKVRRK